MVRVEQAESAGRIDGDMKSDNIHDLIRCLQQLILAIGVTYAAVPLYRAFCSATGYSGTPMTDRSRFLPDRLYADPETTRKRITVHFEATPSDALPWTFAPVTRSVKVLPGETALAFYTAKNNSDKDLIGIATYNMTPEKVCTSYLMCCRAIGTGSSS